MPTSSDEKTFKISQATYDSLIRADTVLLINNLYIEHCLENSKPIDLDIIHIFTEALI